MTFPFKIIDLSHAFSPEIPSWNGSCGFRHETKLDYDDCTTALKFRIQQLKMHAGIGTHLDAPSHCIPGGKSISDLNLQDLIAPCILIDVSSQCHERYRISPQDIITFEQQYGCITKGAFVIFRTGWERFWENASAYRNNHVYPCLSEASATLLLERSVVGLGIDTLSPDSPEDGHPVHRILLGSGKYIIENMANLEALPIIGSTILALPLKIKGGTEAPARVVAFA